MDQVTPFQKIYRSFEEFERNELRKFDSLSPSVERLVDEMLLEELRDARPWAEDELLLDGAQRGPRRTME